MSDTPPFPNVSRLVALHDEVRPADLALVASADEISIGRANSCQIVIPRQVVSRVHAFVSRDGQRYFLRDAGSVNGTFVNGARITRPHLLTDRDGIGLGAPIPLLRFHDPDPTLPRATSLRYDEPAMRFFLGLQAIDLAPSEFRLLRYLYDHASTVCPRESCAAAIWGEDYPPGADAAALDRVLANLRGKLRRADPRTGADLIRVRRGLGYELVL